MTQPPPPGFSQDAPFPPPRPLPAQGPLPVQGRRGNLSPLPLQERAYHQFFATPTFRWWKPIAAVALVAVAWFAIQVALGLPALIADGMLGPDAQPGGAVKIGPWGFLANNVAIASAIPLVMLASWWIFGQRPRWLSSIAGGFRWGWLARCLTVIFPIWLVMMGVEFFLAPPTDLSPRWYTLLMIVGILVTTPFQAAGEEYLIRGFLQRAVGSYFSNEVVGWVVATLVGSLTFMTLHLAADPWLNAYYVAVAVAASWMTWRTGGLEAAVALHVVNNLLSEVTMPFTDFSNMMDRSVGTGDATILFNIAVMAVAVALIDWLARRNRLPRRTAPGTRPLEWATPA